MPKGPSYEKARSYDELKAERFACETAIEQTLDAIADLESDILAAPGRSERKKAQKDLKAQKEKLKNLRRAISALNARMVLVAEQTSMRLALKARHGASARAAPVDEARDSRDPRVLRDSRDPRDLRDARFGRSRSARDCAAGPSERTQRSSAYSLERARSARSPSPRRQATAQRRERPPPPAGAWKLPDAGNSAEHHRAASPALTKYERRMHAHDDPDRAD